MRRRLARHPRRLAPLAKYITGRRALATEVHAFTPARFLHRLGLIETAAPWDTTADARLPEPHAWVAPAELEPPPVEHTLPVTPRAEQAGEPGVAPRPAPAVAASIAVPPVAMPFATSRVEAPRASLPLVPGRPVRRWEAAQQDVAERPAFMATRAPAASPPVPAAAVPATVLPARPAVLEPSLDEPPLETVELRDVPPEHRAVASAAAAAVASLVASLDSLAVPDAGERVTPAIAAPAAPAAVSAPRIASPAVVPAPAGQSPDRNEPHGDAEPRAHAIPPPLPEVAMVEAIDEAPGADLAPPAAAEVPAVPLRAADAPVPEPERAAPPVPRLRASVQEMPRMERRPAPRQEDRVPPPRPPQRPYGAPPPDEASRRDADLAFGPGDGSDRSPLAWAARLADSLRDPSAPAARPSPPTPAPPIADTRPAAAAPIAAVAPAFAARPSVHARRADALPSSRERLASVVERRASSQVEGQAAKGVNRAVPVSPEARRFLLPLVGVDAADATFVQGPAAEAVTSARHADAVTAGDVVALGPDYAGDTTPEGLGLLAHELTHVARRTAPRFVPPVARPRSMRPASHVTDEESVALRVEGRVRAAAAAGPQPQPPFVPAPARPSAFTADAETGTATVTESVSDPVREPAAGADAADIARSEQARARWGGLPAPWEPMPDLTSPPEEEAATAAPLPAPVAAAVAALALTAPMAARPQAASPLEAPPPRAAGLPPASFDGAAHAEAVHAADHDRAPESPAPASGEHAEAKAPDLDRLARQVYSVLKRRLQADAARERA